MIGDMALDGMTVLVSTHYMDEAERCRRVVYLSGGRLVVQGTAEQVVAGARLTVLEIAGEGVDAFSRQLRGRPGVESATMFGRALRAVGPDRAALLAAVADLPPGLASAEVPARLDDVFIHMLGEEGHAR
jgi:ABC-type multidrug transport system ATPase subunit